MAKDVLIRLSALGDILLAVPVIRALERQGRAVRWIIGSKWAELAALLPGTIRVLETSGWNAPAAILAEAKACRRDRPDRVIDLQGKVSSFLLSLLIGRPTSRYQKRSGLEQWQVMRGTYPFRFQDRREIWRKYAQTAGLELSQPDGRLNVDPEFSARAARFIRARGLTPGGYVVIHPEASHAPKALPEAGLTACFGVFSRPVVLVGDRQRIPAPVGARDLRGETSLSELMWVLSEAAAVISTDSGPMHLARAFDRPLGAVFLQTDPCLGFAPLPGPDVTVVSRDLPCKPCSIHGQRLQCPEGHWNCRNLDWTAIARDLRDFFAGRGVNV